MLENLLFEKVGAMVAPYPVLADQTRADVHLTQQGGHFPLSHIVATAVLTPASTPRPYPSG